MDLVSLVLRSVCGIDVFPQQVSRSGCGVEARTCAWHVAWCWCYSQGMPEGIAEECKSNAFGAPLTCQQLWLHIIRNRTKNRLDTGARTPVPKPPRWRLQHIPWRMFSQVSGALHNIPNACAAKSYTHPPHNEQPQTARHTA